MTDQPSAEPQSLPVCPHCSLTLRHSADPRCPFCGVSLAPEYATSPIPWENRSRLGLLKALLSTIAAVLFSPGDFFNRMRVKGGLWNPLFFYLIVGTVTGLVALVYQHLLHLPDLLPIFPKEDSIAPGTLALLAVLQPVTLIAGLFVGNAIFHFCLILVKGAKRNFDATLPVLCYSEAASVCALIPVWGNTVALIWAVILVCIGLSRAHNIAISRAILAVLLPFIALGFCLSLILLIGAISRLAA